MLCSYFGQEYPDITFSYHPMATRRCLIQLGLHFFEGKTTYNLHKCHQLVRNVIKQRHINFMTLNNNSIQFWVAIF